MFAKLLAFFKREERCVISGAKAIHAPNCAHFVHDLDEIAERLSAKVLAGIRKEIAKAKQVAARPKVAVKRGR